MPEPLDSVPRIHPGAGVQRVSDRLLAAGPGEWLHVFEDEAGEASEVGARIVELVDGQRSVREIARALSEEFDVDVETCARDTADFLRMLADRELLVLAAGEGRP